VELKLKAVPEKRRVYTTKIKGKDVVMAFFERNRGKAEDKFNSITIRTKALAGARTLATTEKAECYVGVSVSVAGRFSDSWAIPSELFKKTHVAQSDFALTQSARATYEAASDTVHGFRVEIESAPAPAPKAARKPKDVIGSRVTIYEPGKAPKPARKPRQKPTTATKAATAQPSTPAPESPAPVANPAPKPVDPLAATTVVDGNGAPVGKASAWTAEEEREIARYQETEGLSRKSAVQKMRRRQQAATPTPIYA